MGKYALIGGSTGIGAKLAISLASKGNTVYVFSRHAGELAGNENIKHQTLDINDETQQIPDIDGPIDGLCYLPGSITLKPFRALKPNDFLTDFQINLLGAVKSIQHFLPNLKLSGAGSILLFSTVAVNRGMPFHASIAASKGAIEGMARSLAAEFAPTIRVNVIAPSLSDTPLAKSLLNSEAKLAASAERHPLKRVGKPEDISAMAEFLLSPQNSWITGQIIGVDGGLSAI